MKNSIILKTNDGEILEGKSYTEIFYFPYAIKNCDCTEFILEARDENVKNFEDKFMKAYIDLMYATDVIIDRLDGDLGISLEMFNRYKDIVHHYHACILKAVYAEDTYDMYYISDNAGLYLKSVLAERKIRELTRKRKKAFVNLHYHHYSGKGSIYCEDFYEKLPISYKAEKNRRLFSKFEVYFINKFLPNIDFIASLKDTICLNKGKILCLKFLIKNHIKADSPKANYSVVAKNMVIGPHLNSIC